MSSSVSNVTKLRWQRDAHRVLGPLLQVNGMPVVTWTIAISGALVGDVDSLASTPAEMREAFAAWVRQLDAKAAPERVDGSGGTHLYATFKVADGSDVGGAIRATIYPPFEEDGA